MDFLRITFIYLFIDLSIYLSVHLVDSYHFTFARKRMGTTLPADITAMSLKERSTRKCQTPLGPEDLQKIRWRLQSDGWLYPGDELLLALAPFALVSVSTLDKAIIGFNFAKLTFALIIQL